MKKIALVALPLTMVLAACGGAETEEAVVVDPAVTTTEPVIADPVVTDPAMTDPAMTDPAMTTDTDATMVDDAEMEMETEVAE